MLHAETTERPWLERLLDPRPDGVLIRIDTTVEGSGHGGALDNQAACIGDLKQQGLDGEEASSACVDYVRRIKQPFQLQKKFSLSRYELVTRKEEHALLEDKGNERESRACLELAQTYPNDYRLVELSAVGFNKDQTVAYLYFVEWNPSRHLCQGGVSGHGGPRILYKENGKWRRPAQRPFTDWVTFLDKPELTTVAADAGF